MNKFYVYKHTNIINGKIYIGKSNNPTSRWSRHIYDAKKNRNNGSKQLLFHKAINKYGSSNFILEILQEYASNEEALVGEKFFINKFMSNNCNIGYNLTEGGEGVSGYHRTPEECKNISIRNSGIRNGMYGKIESIESRTSRGNKISKTKKSSKISKQITNQTIDKLKIAVKEKLSQKLTDDQKNEIINLYNSGKFIKRDLAARFGIGLKTIQYIIRYWEQVKNNKSKHLSEDQKNNIISLYETHSMNEVSKITNIPINRIESVIKTHQRKLKAHKLI